MLVLALLAGCATFAPEEPRTLLEVNEWRMYGLERADPGPVQIDAYVAMSRCAAADIHSSAPVLDQIVWLKADSIVPPEAHARNPRGVSLSPGNRIVIVRSAWFDFDLNAHELLHQLIGPGVPHSDPAFRRCDPLYPDFYYPETY